MKAFGYIRVSSKGQLTRDGFDRQTEAINAYAKANYYQLEKIFSEQVSGTKDELDRPVFQDMMASILQNGVRVIIVERLDRLARQYRIQESILIYLASKGISLISASTEENVTESIQDDPMKKALIQIQGIFAELEKNLLVKKLRLARERIKAKTGKCGGRNGYKREASDIIRIISQCRARKNRMTNQQIADYLNEKGYKSTSGLAFKEKTIRDIYSRYCKKVA